MLENVIILTVRQVFMLTVNNILVKNIQCYTMYTRILLLLLFIIVNGQFIFLKMHFNIYIQCIYMVCRY